MSGIEDAAEGVVGGRPTASNRDPGPGSRPSIQVVCRAPGAARRRRWPAPRQIAERLDCFAALRALAVGRRASQDTSFVSLRARGMLEHTSGVASTRQTARACGRGSDHGDWTARAANTARWNMQAYTHWGAGGNARTELGRRRAPGGSGEPETGRQFPRHGVIHRAFACPRTLPDVTRLWAFL